MTQDPAVPRSDPSAHEVRGSIRESARSRSLLRGVSIFALNAASYSFYFAAALWLDSFLLNLLCGVAAGFSISGMFLVGHDAAHDSLTPRKRWNEWLGRLALLPAWTPYTTWKYTHNYLHHGFTNLRTHDPVWRPLSPAEYHALPWLQRCAQRAYRTVPGLPLQWIFGSWIPHRLLPSEEIKSGMSRWRGRGADQWLVLSFAALQIALVIAIVWQGRASSQTQPTTVALAMTAAWKLLVCIVIPYVVWSALISLVDLVQHTHPRLPWFKDKDEWTFYAAQIRSTTHVELPWFLRISSHNILEHNAHHVDPRVPMYHLAEAQADLESQYREDIEHPQFSLGGLRRLLKTCQLYDYDNHQWMTFDGTPTTPRLLPPFAPAQDDAEEKLATSQTRVGCGE